MIQYKMKQWGRGWAKRSAAVVVLVGLTSALVTGCSGSDYEAYKSAVAKTEAATSGVYDMQIALENDFDLTNASEEALKTINYMKSMKLNMTSTIDKQKDQLISDMYVSIGGLGFDLTFYDTGKDTYIKYPVMKKYIDIGNFQQSSSPNAVPSVTLSEATQKALGDIWSGLATKDTVVKSDDVVIPTQNGDLKAKQYNVEVSGEAIKASIIESAKLIAADPEMKKVMANSAKPVEGTVVGVPTTEAQMAEMVKMFDKMSIEKAVIKSFIDVDGYIVQEEIDIAYKNPGMQPNATTFYMKMTNTELNKPVTLEMPTFDANSVYTQEELNLDMPAVFKEFTK